MNSTITTKTKNKSLNPNRKTSTDVEKSREKAGLRLITDKSNLASHEFFPSIPHQHWYKRLTVFVIHSHCNQIRMSRVSLLVVFFLAAAA